MTDAMTTRAIGGDGPARDVDAELDRLIEKRAKAASKAEAEEMMWKASVRRYHEAARRKNRAAWFSYFSQMADNHARLAQDYERRAEALCEEGSAE